MLTIVLLMVLTIVLFLSAPLSALREACFLLQFGCPRRIGEGGEGRGLIDKLVVRLSPWGVVRRKGLH